MHLHRSFQTRTGFTDIVAHHTHVFDWPWKKAIKIMCKSIIMRSKEVDVARFWYQDNDGTILHTQEIKFRGKSRYGSISKTTVQMSILNAASIRVYTANFNGFSPCFYVNGQLLPVVHVHIKIYNDICTPDQVSKLVYAKFSFPKNQNPRKNKQITKYLIQRILFIINSTNYGISLILSTFSFFLMIAKRFWHVYIYSVGVWLLSYPPSFVITLSESE